MCLRLHDRRQDLKQYYQAHALTVLVSLFELATKRRDEPGVAAGVQYSRPEAGMTAGLRLSSNATAHASRRVVSSSGGQ